MFLLLFTASLLKIKTWEVSPKTEVQNVNLSFQNRRIKTSKMGWQKRRMRIKNFDFKRSGVDCKRWVLFL